MSAATAHVVIETNALSKIHVAQILCSNGHCICSLPFNPRDTLDVNIGRLDGLLRNHLSDTGRLKLVCDVCGETDEDWEVELKETRFNTVEEALADNSSDVRRRLPR